MSEQKVEIAQVEEGQMMAARDLSQEHHGWLIKIPNSGHEPTAVIPGPTHRTITFGGIRRWTYDGGERVGILGLETGVSWRGTEYHLPADAAVTLVRHIKRGVPRPRKNDYRDA